jgi:hypothetical protein
MKILLLEKWSSISDSALVVSAVLVALSTFMAVYFGSKLRTEKDRELAKYQSQSTLDISVANVRAAEATEKAATAGAKVAEANRGWEEAKKATALASLDFEKQKERAATAEKELLILKQKISPRHISAEQEIQLLASLKHAAKGNVLVSSPMGNSEAVNYATRISEILIKAGWAVDKKGIGLSTLAGGGSFLIVKNLTSPPLRAVQLQKAFNSVDINLNGSEMGAMDEDAIQIFIGDKN